MARLPASAEEQREARETLELSTRIASGFVRQLGAVAPILIPPFPSATLGRRPSFQATVLDHRYWFSKLYELVTYEEIQYSMRTEYPGFSLHFIKVFYRLYLTALRGERESSLWRTHFAGPPASGNEPVPPTSMYAIEYCVRTGAIAHIQGDMPVALVEAYRTWKANPKPPFQDLRRDFIDQSDGAFRAAQARFYIEVNDKIFSPLRPEVGQLAAAMYQTIGDVQPSLPVIGQWRRDAWQQAAQSL